jgi:transposase
VDLPEDLETLKAMVIAQRAELSEREKLIQEIKNELIWAKEKYLTLRARYFGSSSEKRKDASDQGVFEFNEAEAYTAAELAPVSIIEIAAHTRKKRGRKPRSAEIETIDIVHGISEEEKRCPYCGEMRPEMGEEVSVEYDLVPAHVVRKVHHRKKYGSCRCAGFGAEKGPAVLTALGPVKIIPKSEFTNSTIAFFLVSKYADAIPFYRMEKLLARSGLEVGRATLCSLAIGANRALGDLTDIMWNDVRGSPVILMDETPAQVLHKKDSANQTSSSYMWVTIGFYLGKPIVIFHYHPTRKSLVPETTLAGFHGYLQTDGYAGYLSMETVEGIIHVGCFAHIRRAFTDARKAVGSSELVEEILALIGGVYTIERNLRQRYEQGSLDGPGFVQKRKEALERPFTEIRLWLSRYSLSVAPQSAVGKAIAYAQGQLEKAVRFVDHELLTPDTNRVENAIRPFVVGRKNWMFNNTELGAYASAGLYSLIETAKANGHEPLKYLSYLFDQYPLARTDEEKAKLLPYHLNPKSY